VSEGGAEARRASEGVTPLAGASGFNHPEDNRGIVMSIKVRIPAPMRQHTGGKKEVEAAGGTVGEVLEDLCGRYPGLRERIYDGAQVRRFVNFTLNNEDVRYLDNLATPTSSGDELDVIPAVAGG
jgi:MoaD family protein